MTSAGADALKAAIRRSLPLIIGLIILGVLAVNAFKQIQGPRYEASARVLISTTPLSTIITGTQPSFVDPQRVQQTAVGIAGSPKLYAIAAKRTNGKFGGSGSMQSATSVTGDPNSDLITFTASSSNPDTAVGTVNAVANSYVGFRGRLASSQVRATIQGLRARLDALPPGSPERAGLNSQLSDLKVLKGNSSDAELIQSASSAGKTSPAPLKDSLVGFAIGLVIALVVVALREAIDTTVRSETDVEELLSAPVLASVRSLPRRTRMVTYGRHEAMFADTYALLAAQLARGRSGDEGSVLAVTSSVSREGKTTTTANLAVAAARRGADVIVADFDFRKPSLADLFGIVARAKGALQVMAGAVPVERTLWSVSLEGPRPRVSSNGRGGMPATWETAGNGSEQAVGSLRVLPAGAAVATREVPQQARLGSLLRELRTQSDIVILDTPPALLTIEMAELSQLIDMVLVVVRQGRVSQRNLRALRRQALTWPAEVTGAVMTDVQPTGGGAYSYYGGR